MADGISGASTPAKDFAGRKQDVEETLSFLKKASPQNRIMVRHGPGGVGKTRFLREVENDLGGDGGSGPKIIVGYLDFDENNKYVADPIEAMLSLRQQLAKGGIRTPIFTYTLMKLTDLEFPGVDFRAKFEELFRPALGEAGDDFLTSAWDYAKEFGDEAVKDTLNLVPGGNIIVRNLRKALNKYLEASELKAVEDMVEEVDALHRSKDRQGLRKLVAKALGDDIRRAMEAEKNAPHVVLMFDTYERLRKRAENRSDYTFDEWVRDLLDQAPLSALITSRDELQWSEVDPNLNSVTSMIRLEALSEEASHDYLKANGVDDEVVRERMVVASEGLPFFLKLSLDTYKEVRRKGREPGNEDFAAARPGILSHFIKHLNDAEAGELIAASYPEQLTEETFGLMVQGHKTMSWGRLGQQSFVEKSGDEYRLLRMMREGLQERARREEPKEFVKRHKELFHYHAGQMPSDTKRDLTPAEEENFLAAYEHIKVSGDIREAANWLGRQGHDSLASGRWKVLHGPANEIAKAYQDQGLSLSKRHREHKTVERGLLWMHPNSDGWDLRREIYQAHDVLASPAGAASDADPLSLDELDERRKAIKAIEIRTTPASHYRSSETWTPVELEGRLKFESNRALSYIKNGWLSEGYAGPMVADNIRSLIDLSAGFHQVGSDRKASEALLVSERLMRHWRFDSPTLAQGYALEKGVSLYRAGQHEEAAVHFKRAGDAQKGLEGYEDLGLGGTRLAIYQSLNAAARGASQKAQMLISAEISRLESIPKRYIENHPRPKYLERAKRRGTEIKLPDVPNRALGFAYLARASLRLDSCQGDCGVADLQKAIALWRGPARASEPEGPRSMEEGDALFVQAERMLEEARRVSATNSPTRQNGPQAASISMSRPAWERLAFATDRSQAPIHRDPASALDDTEASSARPT
jgi:hypothetical protein